MKQAKSLEQKIKELQRYDGGHNDQVVEDDEGEYIRLEDVIKLFNR